MKYLDYEIFEKFMRAFASKVDERFATKADVDSSTKLSGLTLDDLLSEYSSEVQQIYKEGDKNG